MLLYLSQEVGFADVEAVAAYHGADVVAGAAAADVAEFVVLRGVGGGGGDEGLRFAFAEPALGGCGGHGLREGDFLGKFGKFADFFAEICILGLDLLGECGIMKVLTAT